MPPKRHTTMSPKRAARYTGKSRFALDLLVRQGKLTISRTPAGLRRYKIADLNKLRRQ